MRKLFLSILAFALLIIGFNSCGQPAIKKVRGLVKDVKIEDDTITNLTISMGEDTMVFNLDEVRYNNGVMLPKDSVIVDYMDGKNDTARAFYVTVLPKKAVTINPEDNKNKELITAPE